MTMLFDDATQEAVRRGLKAWESLRDGDSWENWLAVGRAIEAGKTAIAGSLHTNVMKGKKWSDAYGPWLEETGFDKIDAAVRSRLQNCLDNLPAIENWRKVLTLSRRLELNHPTAVWRAFQKATMLPPAEDPTQPPKPPKAPTRTQKLEQANLELQNTVDELRRREKNSDQGLLISARDRVEDIYRVLSEGISSSKLLQLGAMIMNNAKSTAPTTRSRRGKVTADQ